MDKLFRYSILVEFEEGEEHTYTLDAESSGSAMNKVHNSFEVFRSEERYTWKTVDKIGEIVDPENHAPAPNHYDLFAVTRTERREGHKTWTTQYLKGLNIAPRADKNDVLCEVEADITLDASEALLFKSTEIPHHIRCFLQDGGIASFWNYTNFPVEYGSDKIDFKRIQLAKQER